MVRESPSTDTRQCRRSFLFLQTIASPFFLRLGQRLADNGCAVSKVNFNGGDYFFWNGFHEINFRDKPSQFQDFLEQVLEQQQVTDIVLFGDCRPWHQKAITLAKSRGIAIWVFEEGYIRPHWITLELGGVNGHSSFPKQADIIHELANKAVLPTPEPVGGGYGSALSMILSITS